MTIRPEYLQQNVIRAALNDDWAILPRKLDQIAAFLELRANGWEVQESVVKSTVGESPTKRLRELVALEMRAAASGDWEEDQPVIVDGVQILGLYGTLAPRMNLMMNFSGGTSTQKFSKQVDQAAASDKVKTILVEVDSPGGVVSGTEEARRAIKRAAEQKRVVVVGRNMMASAAYYIGAAGSEVFASPSTEVGSIGVYTILENVVEAAEKQGVRFYVYRAGDLKAAGNPYEKLTDERQAAVQARIDGAYQMFLAAVAEDRGVSTADVERRFGQGSVKLAAEAAKAGMIDGVRLIEDVLADERKSAKGVKVFGGVTAADSPIRPASAGETQTPAVVAGKSNKERSTMDPKIKAALFAAGIIGAIDADDATCQAALNAWFKGRGEDVPSGAEKIVAALMGGPKVNDFSGGKANVPAAVTAVQPAANVQAAHDRELAEDGANQRAGNVVRRRKRFRRASKRVVAGHAEEVPDRKVE
jgi:signal peptide peptidase SppA